jgi:hypothetical protein
LVVRKPKVVEDIWDAIYNDEWMWLCTWGKNRKGKSTLAMQLAYEVYQDWDQVLQSIVWNLGQLKYKIKNGLPKTILTRNGLHNRVPVLIPDDFGATSNKAKTQHELAWDIFKGAIDTYSTRVAVLLGTMLQPSEPTFQIYQKFTHELWVYAKGRAKYDEVDWQQDFKGWQARQNKNWIDSFTFEPLPSDVYKQYDEMRCSIADELDQQIDDIIMDTQTAVTLKRLQPDDIGLMELIEAKGQVQYDVLYTTYGNKYHNALVRCKARSLVVPIRKQTSYWYDLTTFGFQVLEARRQAQKEEEDKAKVPLKTLNISH